MGNYNQCGKLATSTCWASGLEPGNKISTLHYTENMFVFGMF